MGKYANRGEPRALRSYVPTRYYWWHCSICGDKFYYFSDACACCLDKKKEIGGI